MPNGERYGGNMKGREIYRALSERYGNAMEASKKLLAAGVPGLRYLDAGSRGADDSSHNYVIWDESRIVVQGKLDGLCGTNTERSWGVNWPIGNPQPGPISPSGALDLLDAAKKKCPRVKTIAGLRKCLRKAR